ncbi:hypothetical protein VNO77_00977 [Canavalia gladiata]|uniref:Uncharacterized protein n=1 Tax=Canavalia gladiata TaxID=3824 RepID=A0AAN9MWY9_CANGL
MIYFRGESALLSKYWYMPPPASKIDIAVLGWNRTGKRRVYMNCATVAVLDHNRAGPSWLPLVGYSNRSQSCGSLWFCLAVDSIFYLHVTFPQDLLLSTAFSTVFLVMLPLVAFVGSTNISKGDFFAES